MLAALFRSLRYPYPFTLGIFVWEVVRFMSSLNLEFIVSTLKLISPINIV